MLSPVLVTGLSYCPRRDFHRQVFRASKLDRWHPTTNEVEVEAWHFCQGDAGSLGKHLKRKCSDDLDRDHARMPAALSGMLRIRRLTPWWGKDSPRTF